MKGDFFFRGVSKIFLSWVRGGEGGGGGAASKRWQVFLDESRGEGVGTSKKAMENNPGKVTLKSLKF